MSGVTRLFGCVRSPLAARLGRFARGVRSSSGAAVSGLAALCGSVALAASAHAQPASTEQSSWTNVPVPADASLADPLVARGREVFHARCIACHGAIPEQMFGALFLPPMPGTQALQTRYRGEIPAELERRTDLMPALIESVVRKGLNSMPPFRPTEVSNDDLAALVAYLTRKRD